ncbi:hypothetical protein SVIO_005170 [Streptomyces violaceusniger]|uniref:Uncharacterized protein n=1 Tax=Streptomyces violaceusniger TaxID=68280 RepID=A0A4D4KP17_STRVO|nr:hypothetical protein SVIO_005170 [Streptomyces violaceusniger]
MNRTTVCRPDIRPVATMSGVVHVSEGPRGRREEIGKATRTPRGHGRGGVLALVAVAACGSGSAGTRDGFHPVKQTDGTLTVWVDSTRLAAAKLYKARHPSVKMDIVTYDGDANGSTYLRTKVSLFNRTRHGWPDVVFSSQNNETSWAAGAGFTALWTRG